MATRVGGSGIVYGSSGSIPISTPAGAQAGDIAIVFVADDVPGATISGPVGWSKDAAQEASDCSLAVFSLVFSGTPSASYTFTNTGETGINCKATMVVFRPGAGETYVGLTANLGTNTNFSLTAVGDPSVLVAGFANDSNFTITSAPSGMTLEVADSASASALAVYYEINPTGDPVTKDVTWSGADTELNVGVLLQFSAGTPPLTASTTDGLTFGDSYTPNLIPGANPPLQGTVQDGLVLGMRLGTAIGKDFPAEGLQLGDNYSANLVGTLAGDTGDGLVFGDVYTPNLRVPAEVQVSEGFHFGDSYSAVITRPAPPPTSGRHSLPRRLAMLS